MPEIKGIPPPVQWAQRDSAILLSFMVEDCKEPEIKIESDKIYFKGIGGTEKKHFENTINLYEDINAEKSQYVVKDRIIDMILVKKEAGPYWPHLTKEKVKCHWLKVDFSKWVDDDESGDEQQPQMGIEELMSQMGGGGGGVPGQKPSLDDLEIGDSDDEDLPDLE